MRRQVNINRRGRSILRIFLYLGFTSYLFVSCNKIEEGMIIAVELSSDQDMSFDGATLIALDPENPQKPTSILGIEFHSACSPVVSNNGRHLIFSGKKKQEDPWQIWRMDLQKNSTSRVTDLAEDCTDPAFLPDGKIVFSRTGTIMETEVSLLFKCNMNGSDLQQLTFHPHRDYASSVLNDGRILYISSQQYPTPKDPVFMVMRPDGTKSELFYRGVKESFLVSSGSESVNGTVFFIESSRKNLLGGKLMKLNQNRPLFTAVHLSEGLEGEFLSVVPGNDLTCLVSYRPSTDLHFALYEFDITEQKFLGRVYAGDNDVFDPVVIRIQKRPPILPSAVNPENPTGLLMSQNINHSILNMTGSSLADTVANHILITGLEGPVGESEVEEDGSFYLKVDADIPFRMVTLNAAGETIRGPSEWIWLRPDERRGCVGCHPDPELAPENRVPMAVKHPPVIISSKEKEISKMEVPEK